MNHQTYGFLNIYYGTTSGNSKKMAQDFTDDAKKFGFLPVLCNLGDFNLEKFVAHRLTILFLSTYGQGGPTEDAQRFLEGLHALNKQGKPLQQMGFVIFGLGNSTFQFFCGMAKKTKALLQELGAREIIQTYQSDAKNEEPYDQYLLWKKVIFEKLVITLNLQKIEMSTAELANMTKKFTVKHIPTQIQKWDEKDYENLNLAFEIKKFLKAEKSQVIEIKQIRKSEQGRSTLYIRIKTNAKNLTPACNVQIYPQNIVQQSTFKGSVQFTDTSLLPFPPIPIKNLMKITNCSSKPTKAFLQQALYLAKSEELVSRYQPLLQKAELWQKSELTSQEILKQLDLGIQHRASLGVNLPRVYTLAGWKQGQIELIVSLFIVNGKMGLTSKFLQSRPKQIRIKVLSSSFFIPQNSQVPLVMIANGSGIAPFRSILHYYTRQNCQIKAPPLYLYYGCQKIKQDFYFQQQWQEAQKNGLIKLRIATSRQGQKHYVQNMIKSDMTQFKDLLFEKKSIFFICGSLNMDKQLNSLFLTAFKDTGAKPYIAITKVKELQRNKRIVKEVYG